MNCELSNVSLKRKALSKLICPIEATLILRCPVALPAIAMLSIGPVSYTPLRAHETVLDIVCRLQHEKKKKNNIGLSKDLMILRKGGCVFLGRDTERES